MLRGLVLGFCVDGGGGVGVLNVLFWCEGVVVWILCLGMVMMVICIDGNIDGDIGFWW